MLNERCFKLISVLSEYNISKYQFELLAFYSCTNKVNQG